MKEIIRNEAKIEQVCNTIDPFGTVTHKECLLTKWPAFKSKFEKHMELIIQ